MLRHIQILTSLQLCNLFGLNEIRHTKDTKRKQNFTLLSCAWILLIVMLIFYIAMMSTGLCILKMTEIIPTYLYMISSIIILFFSFFKAGSMIFQMKYFDMTISLPVSQTAIVISRFLSMYATNLLFCLMVMVPGSIVYLMHASMTLNFLGTMIFGTLILPMLPMTLSTALGALFTGIGSQMKHKNLAIAVLTIVFAAIILAGSMIFGSTVEELTPEMLQNLVEIINEQVGRIYPPALWFGTSATTGHVLPFIGLLILSLLAFALTVSIVSHHFLNICHALNTSSAKNNYTMESLQTSSILKSLCIRELKRYAASSVYLSNTIIGYILMLILPFALLFTDITVIESSLGFPGIVSLALPFLLGMVAAMAPMTSCSISMEGKHWWLMQTLPVSNKIIVKSKILTNLIVAAPFYLIAIILSIIAIRPSIMNILWLILIPAVYILFSSITGLAVNMRFPVLNWSNEAQVVKQSAAVLVTMLIDAVVSLPPIVLLIISGHKFQSLITGFVCILLILLSFIIYHRIIKRPLLQME